MILAQPEFTKLLAERNFIATQVTRNEVKDDVVILKINILYFIIRDVIGGREEKRKFGQGGSLRLTVCDQGQCLSWGPGGFLHEFTQITEMSNLTPGSWKSTEKSHSCIID